MSNPNPLNATVIGLTLTVISVTSVTLSLMLGNKVELLDSRMGQQKAELELLRMSVDDIRKNIPHLASRGKPDENYRTVSDGGEPTPAARHYRTIEKDQKSFTDVAQAAAGHFKDSMCGLTSDINAAGCHNKTR